MQVTSLEGEKPVQGKIRLPHLQARNRILDQVTIPASWQGAKRNRYRCRRFWDCFRAANLCNVPNTSRTNILILFYYLDEPDS